MATPQSQRSPTQSSTVAANNTTFVYPNWIVYTCGAIAVLGPVALFSPPRRTRLQSLFLAGATSYATSVLMYHYTGASLYQRFIRRWDSMMNIEALPDKAQQTQDLLRRQKERREATLTEEEREKLHQEREKKRNFVDKLWNGDEDGDWKRERQMREDKAFAEGKGYGFLISEHIRDAFGIKQDTSRVEEEHKQENQKLEERKREERKPDEYGNDTNSS